MRRIAAAWHAAVIVDLDALGKTKPALARALSDRDPEVRLFAAAAVSNQRQANPDAIGPLVSLLLDSDSETSATAARALASSGWQALDPLVDVICGPVQASAEQRPERSVEVRRRAIHATRLIVNWYYGQLRRVLEHEAEILAQFDTEIQTYAERLAHVLHDSDDVMRYEAAVCLADILGDVSAFQIVVDSLATPDSVIRRAVAEDIEDLCMRRRGCFSSVANKLGPFVSDADEKVRSRITHALTYCGAKAVSVLEEALGHEDECIRIGAAEALGWLDMEAQAAVPRLLGLLSDPSGRVRQAGAHAIGMVGGAAEIPRLLQLADSDTASDRAAGLHALGLLCSIRPSLMNSAKWLLPAQTRL